MRVADIAREAFEGVSDEIEGIIQPAVLQRAARGAHDPATGTRPQTIEQWPGRALKADEKALADIFPAYVIGPADSLVYLEGCAMIPVETDSLMINGAPNEVVRVGDIVGAGEFFVLIVRPK